MSINVKHTGIIIILLFSTLFFHACKKYEKNPLDIEKIKNKIDNYPAHQRVAVWDSLINLHKNDTITPYLFFQRGYSYYFMDKPIMAIKDLEKAKNLFKKNNNKEMLAKTYLRLGSSFIEIYDEDTANIYIVKGLKLSQELNKPKILSWSYATIGQFYIRNHNYEKAIEYLNKSVDIYKKIKDTTDLIVAYNNIAIVYQEQFRHKIALEYFLKILTLNPENKIEPYNLMIFYDNLGIATFNVSKDKNEAFKYINKALKIANHNNLNPIISYHYLSLIYKKLKKIDSAKYYINKAINSGENNIEQKINLYDQLINLNLKQKQDTLILNLIKKRDSLFNLNQKTLNQDNQKDLENNINLINQQKELFQAKKINKKNKIIFIFIIIMFLLGLVISFQYNRFDVLKHKQEVFRLEQKVLRSQMNPHFVFNVLSSIQNSLLENNPLKSATYLSKFATLIRQNFDYVQKKQILLKDELDMIKNYLDTQKFRFKDKFDYQIHTDYKLPPEKVQIPPMILQPFVENAIKHGFANISYKGFITINVLNKNNKICFEIIDNGVGYKPKKDDKEHALDLFKKRLLLLGKDTSDSFKITRLKQGTKIEFCFDIITT